MWERIAIDGFQLETGITCCFFPETGRFSKKNREAIEHERAITERDQGLR
jgi:hypothetical protein